MTKEGTEVEVTYSYMGNKYRIRGLHYRSEKLWHPKLDKPVYRSHVLNCDKYHDWWPEGDNNTEEIVEDMVTRCYGDGESCRIFLKELCDRIKAALAYGEPGNLRHYWPNILNNNHWHDVASFIKLCLGQPQEAAHLVSLCQEGADVFPLNRLVYRWLPSAERNKGRYEGIDRVAFHGKYQMIKRLLSPTRLAKGGLLRKYGSSGEGKEHRELK